MVTLTTFVGVHHSIFSATYVWYQWLEIGRLTPTFLQFYHALYQGRMIGAMNVSEPGQ